MYKAMDDATFEAKLDELRQIKNGMARSETPLGPIEDPDLNPLNHFQANELLPEVARRARINTTGALLDHPCELLISLVGLSPMTTLTNVGVIRPKRLLLIYTKESANNVNFIHKYANQHNFLDSVSIHQEQCDPRDTLDIYRCIRRFLEGNIGKDIERKHIILDITGGKKSMSATGSLAAWQLELGLIYLDGDFDKKLGFSDPFTQRLFCLDNPSTIFMDQQLREADAMFEQGAYRSAAEAYAKIARFVPMPETARLREKIARLYAAVCALQKEQILTACEELQQELPINSSSFSREKRKQLGRQIQFFTEFAKAEDPEKTPLLTFLLGRHYRQVHQPDFAVLFFYRTLEGCFARRLRRLHDLPEGKTFSRDQIVPEMTQEDVKRFHEIRSEMGLNPNEDSEVYLMGYTSAAILLMLTNDDMMRDCQFLEDAQSRRSLGELAAIRNRSILAHGETPVCDQDAETFEQTAAYVLNSYLRHMLPDEGTVTHLQTLYSFLRKFD
ncbi:MAG: hypothetical protein JJU29_21060 [Verrucomicrobia bacterium]|nr:hypothetical protein [Verrucomicrobiota bacterium]MCH8513849.1 hypothetical protein [Kiritimatiellia bacterium]